MAVPDLTALGLPSNPFSGKPNPLLGCSSRITGAVAKSRQCLSMQIASITTISQRPRVLGTYGEAIREVPNPGLPLPSGAWSLPGVYRKGLR
jgi:hypothetical protein